MEFYHEWRDDSSPYRVGPSLWIAAGKLSVGGKALAKVPTNQWVHIETRAGLGDQSTGTWELSYYVPWQAARSHLRRCPCRPEVEGTGLARFCQQCRSSKTGFYLDNLLSWRTSRHNGRVQAVGGAGQRGQVSVLPHLAQSQDRRKTASALEPYCPASMPICGSSLHRELSGWNIFSGLTELTIRPLVWPLLFCVRCFCRVRLAAGLRGQFVQFRAMFAPGLLHFLDLVSG